MAGDELFVNDDIEGVNLVLGATSSKDVRLLTLSPTQVFINAAARLKNRIS